MDVNIVYFTVHGSGPADFTVWSAMLIEDGEMTACTGHGNSDLSAVLLGLCDCLSQLSTSTPIIIRSVDRIVHQIGNAWLNNWKRDGWSHEPDANAIEQLLQILEPRRIQWFKPPFTDPIDKQVQQIAQTTWLASVEDASHQEEPAPTEHTEFDEFPTDNEGVDLIQPLTKSIASINADDINPIPQIDSPPPSATKEETFEPATPSDTNISIAHDDCEASELLDNRPSVEVPDIHPVADDAASTGPTLKEANSEPPLEPVSLPNPIQTTSQIATTPVKINDSMVLDRHRYPHVDDAGLEQANEILSPTEDTITGLPPVRIMAYVFGLGYATLGSWAFILIDRPSQFALIKGQAHRNSTPKRAMLQSCIEVLMSIRNRTHLVELRLQDLELFTLIQLLIADPMTTDLSEYWEDEGAFVSQLSYWIEQSNVQPRLLSPSESQQDQASREVSHLTRENMTHLNQGLPAQTEQRRKYYPLERLVD